MESPNKAEKERPGNKRKMRFVPYTYRLVPPPSREDDCAEPRAADPVEPVQTQAADADVFDNNDVTDVTDKKGAGERTQIQRTDAMNRVPNTRVPVSFFGVEPFHPCDYCGKRDGVIHHVRDDRHLGRPSMNLHEGCVGPWFASDMSSDPSEPGLSPGRIRELAAWYLDRATAQHEANEAGDISSAELDADLRLILREEVFPEFVEIEFARVMKAVFSEIA
jgi:hypothetical protein